MKTVLWVLMVGGLCCMSPVNAAVRYVCNLLDDDDDLDLDDLDRDA